MSAKFTQGPWIVNGDKIESTTGTLRLWAAIIDDGAGTQPVANAHLIAAAPDLYYELEDSVRLMCNNCNQCELGLHGEPLFQSEVCETYTRKVAVLHKARGE